MRLVRVSNATLSEAADRSDLILAASGYEQRATSAPRAVHRRVSHRVALAFQENPEALSRPDNDRILRELDYSLEPAAADNDAVPERILAEYMSAAATEHAIVIDISSMTRVWYGALVRRLLEEQRHARITTYFVYVPGRYSAPPEDVTPNEIVAPIDGFASLALPNLPIALVLGLGYEPHRATALRELLDPRLTALMIPKAVSRDRFRAAVYRSNAPLITLASRRWLFEYVLDDPSATFWLLDSIARGLETDFRVVLASLGPKLFGLIALALAARRPLVSVWRASSGRSRSPREVLPDEPRTIVCRMDWEG